MTLRKHFLTIACVLVCSNSSLAESGLTFGIHLSNSPAIFDSENQDSFAINLLKALIVFDLAFGGEIGYETNQFGVAATLDWSIFSSEVGVNTYFKIPAVNTSDATQPGINLGLGVGYYTQAYGLKTTGFEVRGQVEFNQPGPYGITPVFWFISPKVVFDPTGPVFRFGAGLVVRFQILPSQP